MDKCPIPPKDFAQLVNLIAKGHITDSIGRTVLDEMFNTGAGPDSIIEEKGLKPILDLDLLEQVLNETIAEYPDVVAKINQGEANPIDFLIGQVMRKTKGKADPKRVKELIHKRLRR